MKLKKRFGSNNNFFLLVGLFILFIFLIRLNSINDITGKASGNGSIRIEILPTEVSTNVSASPPIFGGKGNGLSRDSRDGKVIIWIIVEPLIFDIKTNQNEIVERQIRIRSNSELTLDLTLSASEDFIMLGENKIKLFPNGFKTINVKFDTADSGIKIGKIYIRNDNFEFEIPVIIKVESKGNPFLVHVEIPNEFKSIDIGGVLFVKISIKEIKEMSQFDLIYSIMDSQGNEIVKDYEIMTINKDINIDKTISLPKNLKPGSYLFVLEVKNGKNLAFDSGFFSVGLIRKEPVIESPVYINTLKSNVLLFIIVLLAISAHIFFKLKRKRI